MKATHGSAEVRVNTNYYVQIPDTIDNSLASPTYIALFLSHPAKFLSAIVANNYDSAQPTRHNSATNTPG